MVTLNLLCSCIIDLCRSSINILYMHIVGLTPSKYSTAHPIAPLCYLSAQRSQTSSLVLNLPLKFAGHLSSSFNNTYLRWDESCLSSIHFAECFTSSLNCFVLKFVHLNGLNLLWGGCASIMDTTSLSLRSSLYSIMLVDRLKTHSRENFRTLFSIAFSMIIKDF